MYKKVFSSYRRIFFSGRKARIIMIIIRIALAQKCIINIIKSGKINIIKTVKTITKIVSASIILSYRKSYNIK